MYKVSIVFTDDTTSKFNNVVKVRENAQRLILTFKDGHVGRYPHANYYSACVTAQGTA